MTRKSSWSNPLAEAPLGLNTPMTRQGITCTRMLLPTGSSLVNRFWTNVWPRIQTGTSVSTSSLVKALPVWPGTCLLRSLLEAPGDPRKASSQLLKDAVSPRVLTGKYDQADHEEQYALQDWQKQASDPQDDEYPPDDHCHPLLPYARHV